MKIRQSLDRRLYTIPVLLFLLCSFTQAMAEDVSLAWDPSISSNIAGYKIYFGNSSGSYGAPVSIGNQTAYTITGLTSGTYYFAVTAFDTDGNESDFSNEVSQIVSSGRSCNINDDGAVNALDLQALANIILGINTSSPSDDLNGDGRVDVLDLQFLGNVILGLRSCE